MSPTVFLSNSGSCCGSTTEMLSCFFLECVYLLLAHGAPVKVKNNLGWSPLAEAISYGDRQISKYINYFI